MTLRIVILTACTVLRAGFETLADDPDLEIVGYASTPDELPGLVDLRQPDIVIVVLEEGALLAVRVIARRRPGLPVLVVADALDDTSFRRSIEAGARGFVYKDFEPEWFRSTLKHLGAGAWVLDPRVTGRVIAWALERPMEVDDAGLSRREIEVLRHAVRGEPSKQIARRMGLTQNTIKTYLRRAYKKLDCSTRAAAVAAAERRGLL